MDKHLDITECLHAFANIVEYGQKSEQGYFYEGLWALSMDDGYSIRIFDGRSELNIFFHSQHRLSSPNNNSMESFVRKIYHAAQSQQR